MTDAKGSHRLQRPEKSTATMFKISNLVIAHLLHERSMFSGGDFPRIEIKFKWLTCSNRLSAAVRLKRRVVLKNRARRSPFQALLDSEAQGSVAGVVEPMKVRTTQLRNIYKMKPSSLSEFRFKLRLGHSFNIPNPSTLNAYYLSTTFGPALREESVRQS